MLGATSHVLLCPLELCLNLFVTAIGLLVALMLICACILHAVCLGIFLVVGLGLGVPCWLALGVACFVFVGLKPCAWLPNAPTLNGACKMYNLCLGDILITCFGVGAPC